MLAKLNEDEFKAATDLINGGLTMAKKSMEQILQSPIHLSKIDLNEDEHDVPQFLNKSNSEVHLLRTELMGELKGSCHLIFMDDEVKKITEACLPDSLIKEDNEISRAMKMEFLKEIDNMVAAAVVTEFANILGLEIFGHIPHLHIMASTEVEPYLRSQASEMDSIIHFKAQFHGTELEINPDFVWIFNEKFLDKIKELV